MNSRCLLIIPAIKKNAIIPDQLIKKLHGITLIQRAINIALEIMDKENVLIITDSEEISLISHRNGIKYHYDAGIKITKYDILDSLKTILNIYARHYDNLILFRANTPLMMKDDIVNAYNVFMNNSSKILISVKRNNTNKYILSSNQLNLVSNNIENEIFDEVKAFTILSFKTLNSERKENNLLPYILPYERSIEIESYQDWWVCEKVLQRKKIVFNVIGSLELGMGHIYHSLALAHEITDHEVIFVCDEKYKIAVDKIASMDYKVEATTDTVNTILELKPQIVINDILNTNLEYISKLKKNNILVVNFEDLGEGTQKADLVINELYDIPQLQGDNFLWGYKYLALRDEFNDAIPHKFENKVKAVLITFGGTDQNNLTFNTLKSIIYAAQNKNIKIYIVCGSGYLFKEKLEEYLESLEYKNIELTYAIGVISKIMEKTQIAFSSNGRTVYELADMNIPSVVMSHHEREATHSFATLEKGFLNLGIYKKNITDALITSSFEKLINDNDYRKLLYLNITKYSFRENKQKVVKKIMELL